MHAKLSATAAKDIKVRIADTVEKVEAGAALVSQTMTLADISDDARAVNTFIAAIAASDLADRLRDRVAFFKLVVAG